jgi:intracellular septation protein
VTEAQAPTTPAKAPDHGLLRLALDYVPLIIFFAVYKMNAPAGSKDMVGTLAAVVQSTGAFMVAIVVAALIAKWKFGRVSPMMWLTAILVLGFGGLTIYFHDARFIQIKPTIIYVLLSGLLFGGLYLKKPLMKYVFEAGYDGLSDTGWMKMSRNWAFFFAGLAGLNEIFRNPDWFTFDQWLSIKVWGVSVVSVLFAVAQVPMLLKHGLGDDAADTAEDGAEIR